MSYRDDRGALEIRQQELQRQLEEVQIALHRAREAGQREAQLTKELADVEERLRSATARERSLALEDLRVASPCDASWDEMVGDDKVRFCGLCQKNVYNLASFTRAEAVALVREREGSLCARLARRADGTVLTSDCPRGVRRRRFRRFTALAAGAGLLATGFGLLFGGTTMGVMQGAIPVPAGMTDPPPEPPRQPPQQPIDQPRLAQPVREVKGDIALPADHPILKASPPAAPPKAPGKAPRRLPVLR